VAAIPTVSGAAGRRAGLTLLGMLMGALLGMLMGGLLGAL